MCQLLNYIWTDPLPEKTKLSPFLTFVPQTSRKDFLGPEENAFILDYTLKNSAQFKGSTVAEIDGGDRVDPTRRISQTYHPPEDFAERFANHVRGQLGEIFDELKMPVIEEPTFDVQLAAHGDGAHFVRHLDTMVGGEKGDLSTTRVLSLVYYFCQTPPRFTGGELRIHSPLGKGEPGTYIDIIPQNDLLAVFPSWVPHEVLPVRVEDNQLTSCRFAINCWVNK